MTDEKPDDGYAKFKADHDAYCAVHPAEVAEIEARGEACQQRAAAYERALAHQLTAIKELKETEDGLSMLSHIASVIALEQLHCAALGIRSVPSWEQTLRSYNVLWRESIEKIKQGFIQQEAVNG